MDETYQPSGKEAVSMSAPKEAPAPAGGATSVTIKKAKGGFIATVETDGPGPGKPPEPQVLADGAAVHAFLDSTFPEAAAAPPAPKFEPMDDDVAVEESGPPPSAPAFATGDRGRG